jgi:formate/nitrite transporter FocA (FNT family)
MKPIEKLTKAQIVSFCWMAFCAGLTIGVGGTAYLLACNLFESWGKLIGATLFSLGIFAIVMYEMKLFTGLISDIPEMGIKNFWKLPACFLGNALGVTFTAVLVQFSPLASIVVPQAQALISPKIFTDLWAIKAFCSAILCGFLITLSIGAGKYAPRKGLSTSVGVMFPIIVFAFCGFDHSVANTLYVYYLGYSWQAVGYLGMCILGNIVGGVILPILCIFRTWANTPREQQNND